MMNNSVAELCRPYFAWLWMLDNENLRSGYLISPVIQFAQQVMKSFLKASFKRDGTPAVALAAPAVNVSLENILIGVAVF